MNEVMTMSELATGTWGNVSRLRPRPAATAVPVPRTARELLHRGDRELDEARRCDDLADRFTHAHLAALRFAGAVISARHPGGRSARGRSAWQLLSAAEPEMARWSAFFASGAPVRAAIEGGRASEVSADDAREWLEAAESFGDDVRLVLGGAEVPVPLTAAARHEPVLDAVARAS